MFTCHLRHSLKGKQFMLFCGQYAKRSVCRKISNRNTLRQNASNGKHINSILTWTPATLVVCCMRNYLWDVYWEGNNWNVCNWKLLLLQHMHTHIICIYVEWLFLNVSYCCYLIITQECSCDWLWYIMHV